MAKGKKRAGGEPPQAAPQENTAHEKRPAYAERDEFSLEAQSVPAEALKPKPKQGDLRLNTGAAPRSTVPSRRAPRVHARPSAKRASARAPGSASRSRGSVRLARRRHAARA